MYKERVENLAPGTIFYLHDVNRYDKYIATNYDEAGGLLAVSVYDGAEIHLNLDSCVYVPVDYELPDFLQDVKAKDVINGETFLWYDAEHESYLILIKIKQDVSYTYLKCVCVNDGIIHYVFREDSVCRIKNRFLCQ